MATVPSGSKSVVRRPPRITSTGEAAATDLASVITLANELRAALVEKGLIKGTV